MFHGRSLYMRQKIENCVNVLCNLKKNKSKVCLCQTVIWKHVLRSFSENDSIVLEKYKISELQEIADTRLFRDVSTVSRK